MTTCPNGHESTWPDWCSTCGERLVGADAAAGAASGSSAPTPAPESANPVAAGPTCPNCGVPRHEHDVFCESCGYDFASGSLPEGSQPDGVATDEAESTDAGATGSNSPAAVAQPMHAKISVDIDFFAASVGEVELAIPDPLPDHQIVPLAGIRILIGRKSTSRGIFPEIDVRALTDDPAVSSRHAMLERDAHNNWTLTDLGSTNGTFLSIEADDAIEAGTAIPIDAGTAIFVGAWTRIDLAATAR